MLLHMARARASRATPTAPAPTAMPAFPATERTSVVGAAMAPPVEEAAEDEDEDVFVLVPELVSEDEVSEDEVLEDEVSVAADAVVEV